MVVNHALGVAGGAGGVVQGDGLPFVGGGLPGERRIALGQQRFIVQRPQLRAARELWIIHIDHQRLLPALDQPQRPADGFGELPVGEQDLGFAVLEHERDGFGVQPDVQGVQHGPGHRNPEVQLEHFRDVGQHGGHRVAQADAALAQRRGQAPTAGVGLRPVAADRTMHHGGMSWINRSGALDKGQRGQRHEIGRVPVQTHLIGIVRGAHGV